MATEKPSHELDHPSAHAYREAKAAEEAFLAGKSIGSVEIEGEAEFEPERAEEKADSKDKAAPSTVTKQDDPNVLTFSIPAKKVQVTIKLFSDKNKPITLKLQAKAMSEAEDSIAFIFDNSMEFILPEMDEFIMQLNDTGKIYNVIYAGGTLPLGDYKLVSFFKVNSPQNVS